MTVRFFIESGRGFCIGGFFAEGGRPPTGVPSIVGEEGPELFVPDTAGTVLSNEDTMAAMNRYSPSNGGANSIDGEATSDGLARQANEAIQTTFKLETSVINGVEYATVDQVRAMGAQATKNGAKMGEAQTLRKLQMSPGSRRKLGL